MRRPLVVCLALSIATIAVHGAPQSAPRYPPPTEGDVVLKNFHFKSGETLAELRIHYRAFGTPVRDAQGVVRNAVLVMHGTGGTGAQFVSNNFAGELFGAGQLLDATRYYIVLPDDIGHGGSSKPSNGLHARFPHYGYLDMIEAEYQLLTGLGVNHLRLVMGTSMGGMHTWLWGEEHADFMDALMPLASVPTQVSGRNRAWRRVIIDGIMTDPEWKSGEYTTEPPSLRIAADMLYLMTSNPGLRQKAGPTLAAADQSLDTYVANYTRANDANDALYTFRASEDYDPGPKLEQIKAPLVAVNSADDLINPPELGILEKEITRVAHGRAVVLPRSDKTAGHGTHTLAAVWKQYLDDLLKESTDPAPLAAAAAPMTHPAEGLQIVDARLGKGVQDRMITDEATTFAVNDRVYLWIKLTGGPSDPIRVAWTIGDYTHNDTSLTVGGDPWRTWSYKTVFKAGEWTVTVTDSAGAVLKEMTFTVQ